MRTCEDVYLRSTPVAAWGAGGVNATCSRTLLRPCVCRRSRPIRPGQERRRAASEATRSNPLWQKKTVSFHGPLFSFSDLVSQRDRSRIPNSEMAGARPARSAVGGRDPPANRWRSRALGSGVAVPDGGLGSGSPSRAVAVPGRAVGESRLPTASHPSPKRTPQPAPEARPRLPERRENWLFGVFNVGKSSRNPRNPGSSAHASPTSIPQERRGQAQSEGPGSPQASSVSRCLCPLRTVRDLSPCGRQRQELRAGGITTGTPRRSCH